MRAVVFASALLLSACASVRTPSGTADALPLVSPAALGGDHAARQIVHGAFGEREVTLNCVLSVRGDALTVVGLTAMGVRVFTLHYDGKSIQVDRELPVPAQLTPERLLADIQLVFWPLGALQPALQSAGWRLTEPYAATRRLSRGDRLIAEVHYDNVDPWRGRSWLVNLQYNYTLGIESTSMTEQ